MSNPKTKLLRKVFGIICALAVLLASLGFDSSALALTETAGMIPPEQVSLPNGLKVLILEDHAFPIVSSMVWYRTGSRNETLGTTGVSHLVEHLLMRRAGNMRPGELAASVARAGGQFNGYTSDDFTTFFEVLPATRLELALQIESERMKAASFTEKDVQDEVANINKEFEQESKNPAQLIAREVRAVAYQQHPYHNPTMGWQGDVEKLNAAYARSFYDRYFRPDNATLVIAGDVKAAVVLPLVKKYFGVLPRPASKIPSVSITEPLQKGERQVSIKSAGKQEILQVAYHAPALSDADAPALTVIEKLLNSTYSGRFRKALLESKLCWSASARFEAKKDPGLFEITCTAAPGTGEQKLLDSLELLLGQLRDQPIADGELKRARNQAEFSYFSERDGPYRAGFHLGYFDSLTTWQNSFTWAERLRAVSAADIQRAAKKYFNPDYRVIGWVSAAKAAGPKPDVDPPANAEPKKTPHSKSVEHVRMTGYKNDDNALAPEGSRLIAKNESSKSSSKKAELNDSGKSPAKKEAHPDTRVKKAESKDLTKDSSKKDAKGKESKKAESKDSSKDSSKKEEKGKESKKAESKDLTKDSSKEDAKGNEAKKAESKDLTKDSSKKEAKGKESKKAESKDLTKDSSKKDEKGKEAKKAESKDAGKDSEKKESAKKEEAKPTAKKPDSKEVSKDDDNNVGSQLDKKASGGESLRKGGATVEVREAGKKEGATVDVREPGKAAPDTSSANRQLDESKAIAPSLPSLPKIHSESTLHAVHQKTLSNGINLVVLESHLSPVVQVVGAIKAGEVFDSANRKGLSALTAAALNFGSSKHNKLQMNMQQEDIGLPPQAMLRFEGGFETIDFETECLSKDLVSQLSLLGEILSSPGFQDADIERAKQDTIAGIKRQQDSLDTKVNRALLHSLVAAGSAYCPADPAEKVKNIAKFDASDLKEFQTKFINPGATCIVIAGDITVNQASQLAEKVLSGWSGKATRQFPSIALNSRRILRTSLPIKEKSQPVLCFGQLVQLSRNHQDYAPLLLADCALTNHPIFSRLGQLANTEPQLASAVGADALESELDSLSNAVQWSLTISPNTNSVPYVVRTLQNELRNFSKNGITAQELAEAKRYLAGAILVRSMSTLGGASRAILDSVIQGGEPDYIGRVVASIKTASLESVNKVIRTAFKPDQASLVIAGSSQSITAVRNQTDKSVSNTQSTKVESK